MNSTLRSILAVITGIALGSIVNMLLVTLGHALIPPPGDTSTMEAMKESLLLFQAKDFIFPFVAHAGGTFVGAYIAARIATNKKKRAAMVIAVVFLLGGISMIVMLPSPLWFTILDLLGAYIPMAWIGWKLAEK
jgi:hypothetical protein